MKFSTTTTETSIYLDRKSALCLRHIRHCEIHYICTQGLVFKYSMIRSWSITIQVTVWPSYTEGPTVIWILIYLIIIFEYEGGPLGMPSAFSQLITIVTIQYYYTVNKVNQIFTVSDSMAPRSTAKCNGAIFCRLYMVVSALWVTRKSITSVFLFSTAKCSAVSPVFVWRLISTK